MYLHEDRSRRLPDTRCLMGRHSKPEKKIAQEDGMARGNDPGRDFDDQYHRNRRAGQDKASRGESHWAADKYLENNNSGGGGGNEESCGKATVVLLAILAGLGWVVDEAVRYIA